MSHTSDFLAFLSSFGSWTYDEQKAINVLRVLYAMKNTLT